MGTADTRLIEGLQARNADRKHATDGHLHPRRPIGPAAARDLRVVERRLKFRLPELLRAVYTRVGNGGFGPAYGIVGTTGGFRLDGCLLESCYQKMLLLQEENPIWRWPRRLLPVANYGCGMWSCVDCEYKTLPMFLWDPNNLDEELSGLDAQLNWGGSFWTQRLLLRTWLDGWLHGRPEPEPKWPSNTWMRRRLGFALSK